MYSCHEINTDDIRNYCIALNGHTDEYYLSPDDASTSAHFLLTAPDFENSRAVGAFFGIKLVGYCIVHRVYDSVILDLIHVHPDFRGKKVGSLLVDHVKPTEVCVVAKNNVALSLYRKYGLTIEFT